MSLVTIEATASSDAAREALKSDLGFGRLFADLMLTARHTAERGWHEVRIVPYGPLSLSPAAKVLHYGLEIFEGHKAYKWPSGDVALFRPEANAQRLNASARRLCLPEVPVEHQLAWTDALIHAVRDWVPQSEGSSAYVRPTLIATEPSLGVRPASEHLYYVIVSPVGPYFKGGFKPISVLVEPELVRASVGGIGAAKTGGNYAAGLLGQERAIRAGFDQVLWLDSVRHERLEELNAMNVMVVQGKNLVTPPLTDTILAGVTRRSVLELAPDLGLAPVERPITITEVADGIASGSVTELFAVGTAAVVTPIGSLGHSGAKLTVGDGQPGTQTRRIYEAITAIQFGLAEDRHGWMRVVSE